MDLQCGKCPLCKNRRINQWVFRIKQEQKRSTSSHFVTLTYAPKYLPKTSRNLGTLKKYDVQNFIRRLREYEKHEGNTSVIKYFAAGEYGTETKRPHYHICLLNVQNKNNIGKAWTKKGKLIGNIDIGTLTQQSIAYTIKYIDKTCFIGYARNDERERPFQLISKGIGDNYLTQQSIEYHRNNPQKSYVQNIEGYKVGLPRYYAKKIWDTDALTEKRIKVIKKNMEELEQKRKEYVERVYKISYNEYKNLQIQKEMFNFDRNINQSKRNI